MIDADTRDTRANQPDGKSGAGLLAADGNRFVIWIEVRFLYDDEAIFFRPPFCWRNSFSYKLPVCLSFVCKAGIAGSPVGRYHALRDHHV